MNSTAYRSDDRKDTDDQFEVACRLLEFYFSRILLATASLSLFAVRPTQQNMRRQARLLGLALDKLSDSEINRFSIEHLRMMETCLAPCLRRESDFINISLGGSIIHCLSVIGDSETLKVIAPWCGAAWPGPDYEVRVWMATRSARDSIMARLEDKDRATLVRPATVTPTPECDLLRPVTSVESARTDRLLRPTERTDSDLTES